MDYKEVYDLIVAGGGPAGIGAAISAARKGIKALLIERAAFLGGMATNASVPAFCPFSDGEKVIIGGIGFEILNRMKKESYVSPFFDGGSRIKEVDWVPIDPEILKRVSEHMVIESKCSLLLHTTVTNIRTKEGKIISLDVNNKGGNHTIKAKNFIDCSGDADLVALGGGSYEFGDQEGSVQAGTLCFRIANFDIKRFMTYVKKSGEDGNLNVAVKKAKENNDFPDDESYVAGIALQAEGMAGLNFGHVYHLNPLDGDDLTRAEIEGRAKLPELMSFLRNYVPGAENAVLASSGPIIGTRESRRIVGDYKLTKEDYYKRADFDDTIARYSYPIDIHASSPEQDDYSENREFITSKYKDGEAYSIPYRSLIPIGFDNLLVAGRTICSDRAMMASIRVMPACFATGEAAGAAAAICCKGKMNYRDINIQELQDTLVQQGAILG